MLYAVRVPCQEACSVCFLQAGERSLRFGPWKLRVAVKSVWPTGVPVSPREVPASGARVWRPLIKGSHSAFVEFRFPPLIMPKVTVSLNLIVSCVLQPHQLPHLDLGTPASLGVLVP